MAVCAGLKLHRTSRDGLGGFGAGGPTWLKREETIATDIGRPLKFGWEYANAAAAISLAITMPRSPMGHWTLGASSD